ncbi:unnamed protein product [Caenorhabditis bovis]|uniref:EGF-like domain-containing protein n=1 Tax=Caenorhabditis bovis TaxID=2654633 RepID=A0A8S1EPT6_9PELO|nr:unnamed protein product [Caenorhabditis bovis]
MRILYIGVLFLHFALAESIQCENGGFPNSDGICDCPSYFKGDNCSSIECLNGGYVDENGGKFCICPPGYLGIHCEAVKPSPAAHAQFRTMDFSLNIMNFNLYTPYWVIYIDAEENKNISAPEYAGLYWCYPVKIYKNIVKFIKKASLQNSAITIITQHPPNDDNFEEARSMVLAFGIKINVLWIPDDTFNPCTSPEVDHFRNFAENSGGIFAKLQTSDKEDSNTETIVRQILMTHRNPQYFALKRFNKCSEGAVDFQPDPNIAGPYYLTLFGGPFTNMP